MKAVVYTRYGRPDVLRLTDVEMPAPKDSEVLVKVHAVSLNASDWETMRANRCIRASPARSDRDTTYSGQTSPDGLRRRVATRPSSNQATKCSQTSSVTWAGSRSTCACPRANWRECRPA